MRWVALLVIICAVAFLGALLTRLPVPPELRDTIRDTATAVAVATAEEDRSAGRPEPEVSSDATASEADRPATLDLLLARLGELTGLDLSRENDAPTDDEVSSRPPLSEETIDAELDEAVREMQARLPIDLRDGAIISALTLEERRLAIDIEVASSQAQANVDRMLGRVIQYYCEIPRMAVMAGFGVTLAPRFAFSAGDPVRLEVGLDDCGATAPSTTAATTEPGGQDSAAD
ncbi:MAG: hypothetical protein AAF416_22225 [Pseudomonadota bacterium]